MCLIFQVHKVVKKPLHFDLFTASPFIRIPKFVTPSGPYAHRSRIQKPIDALIFQVFKSFILKKLNQVNEMAVRDKLRFLGLLMPAAQMVYANKGAAELLSTAKKLEVDVGRMREDLKEIKNLLRYQAEEAKARRATRWWKIWYVLIFLYD